MPEHNLTSQEKTTTLEKGSRQKAEPAYGQSYAWGQGMYPLIDTPFQPRMDEHAELLKKTRFDTQLASIVMHLQRTYGNRYIQRLLYSMATQAKLTVSQPDDVYEQEADRVADMVTRSLMPQRQEEEEEGEQEEEEGVQTKLILQRQEEEEGVQTTAGNKVWMSPGELETRINNERGGGQPLSEEIRTPMEQAFSADFSGVRIHTDSEAHRLNESLQARAVTTGQDIFFRNGEYSPGSNSGRKLLAHELTHVLQQQAVPTLQRQVPETPAAKNKADEGEGAVKIQQETKSPEEKATGEQRVFVSRIYLRYDDDKEFKLSFDKGCELLVTEGSKVVDAKPSTELKSLAYVKEYAGCWVNERWEPYSDEFKKMAKEWINIAGAEIQAKAKTGELKIDVSGLGDALNQMQAKVEKIMGNGPPAGPVGVDKQRKETAHYLVAMFRENPSEMWKIVQFMEDYQSLVITESKSSPLPKEEKPETVTGVEHHVVYFSQNKDSLSPRAQAVLTKLVPLLQAPNAEANIIGYASTEGKSAYNLDLSRRRADSVATFLEKKGVPTSKLHKDAKGEPTVEEKTKAERARNRRVDIEIIRK